MCLGDVFTWTLDYGLHIERASLADVKNFIGEHDRRATHLSLLEVTRCGYIHPERLVATHHAKDAPEA